MTATLLPNGRQAFYDANGTPLVGGLVYMYVPATETPKNTWQDSGQSTLNTNPIVLDDLGTAVIYGSGEYRQYVTDADGNLIWDELTTDTLSPLTDFEAALQTQTTGSPTTTGTGLVGWRAPGGTSRTLYAKMQELISVKDFGATGDGSTDDTTAIQAAITYLSGLGGGMLYFPRGTYVITTALSISNMDIVVCGDGEGVSVIKVTGAVSCLSISQNSANYFTTLRSLSLYTTQLSVGTAITIDYSSASTSGNPTERCIVDSIEIKASGNQGSAGFEYGLVCTDVTNMHINKFSFIGYSTAASPSGRTHAVSAILIQGSNSPVEAYITNTKAYFCTNGVEVTGSYEGVYVGGECSFIEVDKGVYWHMSSANDPLLFVNSCHVNSYTYGVYCKHGGQINVSDNLLYRSNNATGAVNAVYMEEMISGVVTGNIIYDSAGTNNINGVVHGNNCTNVKSSNNVLVGVATGIWFQAGSFNNFTEGNIFRGTYTNSYLDSGTQNVIGRRGVLLYLNNDQSIANNTSPSLSWDAAQYDTNSFWSSGANITIPSSAGIRKIRINATVMWNANTTGIRGLVIQKGGTGTYLGSPGQDANATSSGNMRMNCISPIIDVSEGDVFTVVVSQNSGGSLNVLGSQRTWVCIEVIE